MNHSKIVSLLAEGRHREAETAAWALLVADREDWQGWVFLGSALLGRDQYAEAERAARRAVSVAPAEESAHALLHQVLMAQTRYTGILPAAHAEADAATRALLRDDLLDPVNHLLRANHLRSSGDMDAAREHFLEAMRLQPGFELASEGLARSLTHWHAPRRWLLLLFLWVRRNVWKLVLFSAVGIYLHSRLPSLTAGAPWAVPLTSAFLVLGAFSLLLLLTSRSLVRLLLVSDRETRSALSHLERRAALLSLPAVLMMLTLCGMWLYAGVHLGSLIRMPMNAFLWAGLTKLIHETFASESDWVRRKMGWIALVCAAGLSVSTTVTFMQSVRFSWDLQQLVQNGEPLDEKQLSERVRELVFLRLRRGEDLPPGVQSAYGVTAPARRMVSRFEFLIVVVCALTDAIRSILERRAPDLR